MIPRPPSAPSSERDRLRSRSGIRASRPSQKRCATRLPPLSARMAASRSPPAIGWSLRAPDPDGEATIVRSDPTGGPASRQDLAHARFSAQARALRGDATRPQAMPLTPPSLTLGLEEEYLLVDPASRDLVAAPPEEFMARCEERLGAQVTHEFLQAQVEIGTSGCRDVGALRAQLDHLRATVAATAREFGMAMIAASTHPFANWRAQKKVEKERYSVLARDMQALASRLVICGMHVHAGIEDDELRIDLMNQASY